MVKSEKLMMVKKYISLLIITLMAASLPAQIETEQVEVVKAFEVQLEDAEKIEVLPKIIVTEQLRKIYQYDVTIVPLDIKYADPVIKPLAMNAEDAFDMKSVYLKGGYGNLRNPYFKMRFGTAGDEKYEIQANLDYYAVNNDKNVDYQYMLTTKGGIGVKYRFAENVFLTAGIHYNIDRRNFYFIYVDEGVPVNPDLLKRNTNRYGAYIGLQNVEETASGFEYNFKFRTDLLSTTNFNANEQILGINGVATYRLDEQWSFHFPLGTNAYRNRISETKESKYYAVIDFKPYAQFQNGNVNIKAGAALLLDAKKFKPWPMLDISYALTSQGIQIYAGTEQRQQINDLANLLAFCPWVNTVLSEINLNVGREYYGGIRGDLKFLSYQARAGFRNNDIQPLFVNYRVRNLESNDKPSVDFGKLSTIFINGSADFALTDAITLGGMITKNFYTPENSLAAYGLLGFEGNVYAKTSFLNNRIKLKGDLYLGDRNATLYPNAQRFPILVKTTNLFDLNLGLEGWITKKIALYIDGNNLLNNKNVRWYGYPQVGIHFNGGVIASF